jgi:hypothetical protein
LFALSSIFGTAVRDPMVGERIDHYLLVHGLAIRSGHGVMCIKAALVEPSVIPGKPPRPRLPTTPR